MSARLFLDERNLQQIGASETNIRFLRALWDFLAVQEVTEPIGAITTTGLLARTGTNLWATRTLTAPAAGFSITNGDGVTGNPTFVLTNDLAGVEGLSSTGIAVRIATDTWANRALAAPAAGFTITNPSGIAGDFTFVLANDLAALEALSGTDTIYYRSGVSTWTAVTIGTGLTFAAGTLSATGTYTNEDAQDAVGSILTDSATIDFTYNDGANTITAIVIAASIGPTQLANTAVTPGSYTRTNLTVDAQGRITAASNGTATSVYAPLTNGTTPGPVLMADPVGQCIMAPIT